MIGSSRGEADVPSGDRPAPSPPDDLVDALTAVVAAEGRSWFPEFGPGRIRVVFRSGDARARCFLYRFQLSDGRLTRPVVVKVRHSRPELRRVDRFRERPVLAPVRTMSDQESAHREFEGLRLISESLRDQDPKRFGVLRPLAWLSEHAAIVTDLVEDPTLRSAVLGRSRLRIGRRTALDPQSWRNAGAWLALFHREQAPTALPARTAAAEDVGGLYRRYADFLVDRLGALPPLRELSDAGADLADAALPAELPLATGHGDFVAANLFAGPHGRITGFDPLPIWRLPVYQDLATLLVGVRVFPVQAASQGLALPREELDGYESEFLRGYFDDGPVPGTAVLAFQLLVLLDRWAALAGLQVQRGGVRPHLHAARIQVASRHYQREARRLLTGLHRPAGAG